MIFRAFRRTDTGEWVDVMFTSTGDEYPADPEAQADDLAAALNIDPALLEAVDGDTDPRTGVLLALPVDDTPSPASLEEQVAALTDAVATLTADFLAGGA